MADIDWSKQHCGVHRAPVDALLALMPDIAPVVELFPERACDFTWDVKVHMLMPRQYPCIPNWHCDNVPRDGGVRDETKIPAATMPMYLWISGPPLTQFEGGYVQPRQWFRFTQRDRHRGTMSGDFCWRGFVRATHSTILPPKAENHLRRHSQVYLDARDFQW